MPGSHGCVLEHDTLSSGADSWKTILLVDKSGRFGMLVPYVTCMLFIYLVYLVSADPDIGDIDGK